VARNYALSEGHTHSRHKCRTRRSQVRTRDFVAFHSSSQLLLPVHLCPFGISVEAFKTFRRGIEVPSFLKKILKFSSNPFNSMCNNSLPISIEKCQNVILGTRKPSGDRQKFFPVLRSQGPYQVCKICSRSAKRCRAGEFLKIAPPIESLHRLYTT
jgi:hypothetical protein